MTSLIGQKKERQNGRLKVYLFTLATIFKVKMSDLNRD